MQEILSMLPHRRHLTLSDPRHVLFLVQHTPLGRLVSFWEGGGRSRGRRPRWDRPGGIAFFLHAIRSCPPMSD